MIQYLQHLIQKLWIELYLLFFIIMAVVAFITPYYQITGDLGHHGLTLFDQIFGINIGWLLFTILIGGYGLTLLFITLDNMYSKRARLVFQLTVLFNILLFFSLFLWTQLDHDFFFGTQKNMLGFNLTIKGGYGFAFYWLIAYIILSAILVDLYKTYEGKLHPTLIERKWFSRKRNH